MGEEQVVKLLEEIRDLQKEFLANQKVALQNQQVSLQNQQESIAKLKTVMRRNKVGYIVLIVVLLFLGASFFTPVLSWFLSWKLRR